MRKISNNRKFKKGAASFYIVAISTLILVIIAASFAAVIVSEVTRTSNDDLSQSAYDSALAGVEDAKLAFYNYQDCKNKMVNGGTGDELVGGTGKVTCKALVNAIEVEGGHLEGDPQNCDLVARALNRDVVANDGSIVNPGDAVTNYYDAKGVLVREGNGNENDMEQYYTCVKISAITEDYLGELDSEDSEHSVRVRFQGEGENGANVANQVEYVRLSWHSRDNSSDDTSANSSSWFNPMTANGNSLFGEKKSTPAVVSLTMVQTDTTYNLSDFDMSYGGTATDRGTLYFVPIEENTCSNSENYICVDSYDDSDRIMNEDGFVKSNDKSIKNEPFAVSCKKNWSQDYACSVLVQIPKPVAQGGSGEGTRNPETFIFSVGLPYGEPKTDYRLEFLDGALNTKKLDGVQVSIDSTGRANDLFRRVDTRLEPADAAYPYPIYGIEALDPEGDPGITKSFDTTCEYNFDMPTC